MKSGRPNLDSSLISSELASRNCTWINLVVLETVTSTNDLAMKHLESAPGKLVVVCADEQTQGRGRLQRDWASPKGAGIALSIGCSLSTFGKTQTTIPLLTGVAVITALNNLGVQAKLKWPNDLIFLSDSGQVKKFGGILLQRAGDQVVLGIGINVGLSAEELPTESSTSLFLEGFEVSREKLIAEIISQLEIITSDNPASWRARYLEQCATVGSTVRVTLADGSHLEGLATQLAESGGLVVEVDDVAVEVTVGDIEHLRHK